MAHLTTFEIGIVAVSAIALVYGVYKFIKLYIGSPLQAGGASALSALLFISFSKTSNQIQPSQLPPTHKRSPQ